MAAALLPACTENSNPGTMVMESAENGDRFDAFGCSKPGVGPIKLLLA